MSNFEVAPLLDALMGIEYQVILPDGSVIEPTTTDNKIIKNGVAKLVTAATIPQAQQAFSLCSYTDVFSFLSLVEYIDDD